MHKHHRIALASATVAALTAGLLTAVAGQAAAAPTGVQGDFDNDGFRDLAVSSPFATVAGQAKAGQITILYGSQDGAGATRRATITQNSTGVPGTAENGDYFGGTTSAGDFNGDGYADLAVGAPGEDVSSDTDGGTTEIIWGSATGLAGGTTIADPAPHDHDRFGAAVAAGDFDGDAKTDLVVGDSSATLRLFKGGIAKSGTAGSKAAVSTPILGGGAGVISLTPGDVDADGRTDLVVNGVEGTGSGEYLYNANYYLHGTASGLSSADAKKLPAGVITAIGDVNGDGYGDLVTGLHWDDTVPGTTKGGKVTVRYGSASGPTDDTAAITQDSGAIPGSSETGDSFGWEVTLGDVNGDAIQDLAIGAPAEDLGGATETGTVTVVYGSPSGLDTTTGVQYFQQDTEGVPGHNESYDHFGGEVFLSDVTGDGKADLTVGANGENEGNGSVVALRSDGTRIVTAGARSHAPSAVGVSTAGTPQFGSVISG
ncbi:FG-GAP-like repeat-containing protein [Streptomyces sp. P1-3]|uniref:FG-GAP-like repeat-containing protein n=1 Tax=Streptomyces sp. P1-3 TaxID=3421658 RepID=UPI003D35EADA